MVTWAMVLETIIKWLIPVICVAVVGLVTAHFVKPFRKGNAANRQDDWDEHFRASQEPRKMGDAELSNLKEELNKSDKQILDKISELSNSINEQNEVNREYHKKVDKSINLIQQGVQDAHLQNLIATCQTYIRRGYITSAEFETYQARYKLYKDLGGNGHMEPWDAKIQALPNEPPQKYTNTAVPRVNSNLPQTHL